MQWQILLDKWLLWQYWTKWTKKGLPSHFVLKYFIQWPEAMLISKIHQYCHHRWEPHPTWIGIHQLEGSKFLIVFFKWGSLRQYTLRIAQIEHVRGLSQLPNDWDMHIHIQQDMAHSTWKMYNTYTKSSNENDNSTFRGQ